MPNELAGAARGCCAWPLLGNADCPSAVAAVLRPASAALRRVERVDPSSVAALRRGKETKGMPLARRRRVRPGARKLSGRSHNYLGGNRLSDG